MTDGRFIWDESRLADLAERYPVDDDHSALLALEAAIIGNEGWAEAIITGPCDLAIDLLADESGKIDGYRVIIHPTSNPADPWIASNIERVSDREETSGQYDTAQIIRDAVTTANELLAWSER